MNYYNQPHRLKTDLMAQGPDITFHRVLWATLVAVALTFGVILTSVFVDIDGLLKQSTSDGIQESIHATHPPTLEEYQDFPNNVDIDDNMESDLRSKRSSDSDNVLYRINNPKMKKILTNRLTVLLDELDEESLQEPKTGKTIEDLKVNTKPTYARTENEFDKSIRFVKDKNIEHLQEDIVKSNVLHQAIHNILLPGLIRHVDVNDVYKKAQLLAKTFDCSVLNTKELEKDILNENSEQLMNIMSHDSYSEHMFLKELLNCKKLHDQISDSKNIINSYNNEITKDPPLLIKMMIEISNNAMKKRINPTPKENVKDLIKLLYNKNPIEVSELSDDKKVQNITADDTKTKDRHSITDSGASPEDIGATIKNNSMLDQAIAEYLKTHTNVQNTINKAKRLKRQIKIRYKDDGSAKEQPNQHKEKSKKENDELYIEIETHFDGKGTKGEKKKKLVRNLIDKIQKAINSDVEGLELDKKVKQEHLQIKKRTQNPLDYKDKINVMSLVKAGEQRQLNPINSIINKVEPLASISDGVLRRKAYNGPGFLTVFKSLNSAEMNELDIDYNSVMKNGIPKRLQMPINTENDDVPSHNDYLDTGNVTLYLKEIEGSGFSIGINQYTDVPPDKESLKLFTGLENLIQAYHEYYDHPETSISSEEGTDKSDNETKNLKKDTNRYKRGARNVKFFTNVKSKSKMQKFLNTKAMQTKKIFLKNKRNKRHVDKIKIIASDYYQKQSNEHIYLIPRDNLFTDRAIIREGDIPEVEIGDRDEPHDTLAPYENIYNTAGLPRSEPYINNLYDIKAFHTELMSKYPHIILEDIPNSKEKFININNKDGPKMSKTHKNRKINSETMTEVTNDYILPQEKNNSLPNVEDIFNGILLPQTNYKLTVKILPKNKTEVGPGFKEVHTIINKSYDKNGVRYVSSMNVSEISQFQHLNKTSEPKEMPNDGEKEQRQEQINLLLKFYKDRIDQQLEHLKVESQQLNGMFGKKDQKSWPKNITHVINVFKQLGLDEKNILPLTKNYHENVKSQTSEVLPSRSMTLNASASTKNSGEDSDKALLISTIKQNENFTRELLQKIDKNTNILQSFLQDFSKRLEATGEDERKIKEKPVDLRSSQLSASDIEQLHKNNTHQIPFIYAFQQPITHNNEKDLKSVANIIYHGHIHANEVKNDGNKNDFLKQVANTLKLKGKNFNKTEIDNNRFFIDDLENDYKLVPSEPIGTISSKNNTKI